MAEKKTAKPTAKAAPKAAAKIPAKKVDTTATEVPKLTVEVLEREIREAAQKVFQERRTKNEAGDELSDWLKAEIIIKKKYRLS
jgi:uncharacterized protein YcbX